MLLVLVCLIIHNTVGDHDNSRYIQHIDNFHTTLPNKTVTQFTLQFYTVNCNNIVQGWIQDFFKGGLGGNSYIIYKHYIYIAIIHIIILINKVHVSTYCAGSYSLHTDVPAATMH